MQQKAATPHSAVLTLLSLVGLQQAAEQQVNRVDGVVRALPQSLGQMLHVLQQVAQQEGPWIRHRRPDDLSDELQQKTTDVVYTIGATFISRSQRVTRSCRS